MGFIFLVGLLKIREANVWRVQTYRQTKNLKTVVLDEYYFFLNICNVQTSACYNFIILNR